MSKKAKKIAKPVKKAKPPKAAKAAKPVAKLLKKVAAKLTGKPAAKKAKPAPVKKAPVEKKGKVKAAAKPVKAAAPKPVTKESAKEAKAKLKAEAKAAAPKALQKSGGAEALKALKKDDKKAPAPAKAEVKDIVLTDAEGRQLCRVKDCDQHSVVEAYCRFHYLLFWKKIQNRKKILSEGKLEQYIEELTSRYPLKFLELIRKDLSSEPDFMSAIQELDIDEGNNIDDFEDENFIDEVRGISSSDTERVDDEY